MKIYPAPHYTMGGLWVDYDLMSTVPGLFVIGEANFSDHGANRLGASALMQGLADGYFILPYTIGGYLATAGTSAVGKDHAEFRAAAAERRGARRSGCSRSAASARPTTFHIELGKVMWDECGMSRNRAGLERAMERIPEIRERFWKDLRVPGSGGAS